MPSCVALDARGFRRQYWPVWLLRSMVACPGWMGPVLLRLLGCSAVYCSGSVLPLPLLGYAGAVVLSALT
jgi:hypothetical protein